MEVEEASAEVPVPETTDPATLLRHMQAHEPLKLALTRDFPLVTQKLVKTARGIREMMQEEASEESLHKGLGWLHYRTLFNRLLFRSSTYLGPRPFRDPPDLRHDPRILYTPLLSSPIRPTGPRQSPRPRPPTPAQRGRSNARGTRLCRRLGV